MNVELIILWSSVLFTLLLLIVFVDRRRMREALLSFMFMQLMAWPFGALVVEEKLIQYPGDFFNYAVRTSFTFEYFILPSISVLFNLRFPSGRKWYVKGLFILGIPGAVTFGEAMVEKHTKIIDYIDWHWYYSFGSMTAVLLVSYWFYRWFFKKIAVLR